MSNVKRISDGQIFQVLDVNVDEIYGNTHFFIWDNDGWRWRSAKNFVPPNYEVKENSNG